MKILYFFAEYRGDFMFQWQRLHFIDELSRHNIKFDILNPLDFDSLEKSYDKLLKIMRTGSYDLFFCCNTLTLNKDIIYEIKHMGIPTVCFRPDNLLIPFFDKELAPVFDLVWLTSKETEYLYKQWGVKYFFAPYAANPYTFKPEFSTLIRKICFIGTPYGSRSNLINSILNCNTSIDVFCKCNESIIDNEKFTPRCQVPTISRKDVFLNHLSFTEGRKILWANFINRFQEHQLHEQNPGLTMLPKVPFEELNTIYSKYALSLSSTSARNTDILSNPVKVANLRTFEIPMAGGLQFCRYSEELSQYFEDGKEIVFYRNKEELMDKSIYYTKSAKDSEIAYMKQAARKRAETEHTWMNRFKIAFDLLNVKY
ncbi:glycosyltransferase [Parabacteroides faecis]|uniref:glycosyltransferase family protein n=1 Tax=Parabacteroides faecis TaxID=1217282 RepID=UPI002164E25D|nr:glycosyltransferase [Parabacteroides faecis]MCS2892244.1 glycosyltransferase [Parabacteroides faecis]UVQ49117.1 glycosyltransferase [Parabacteroides faecis]